MVGASSLAISTPDTVRLSDAVNEKQIHVYNINVNTHMVLHATLGGGGMTQGVRN